MYILIINSLSDPFIKMDWNNGGIRFYPTYEKADEEAQKSLPARKYGYKIYKELE